MKDILILLSDMLQQHLKGEITLTYINGILRAELKNDFLHYSLTVTVDVPEEHLYVPTSYDKIVDNLYQKFRHFVEKNIFTWYD